MSKRPDTVRELIALWPSRKALADDLSSMGFRVSADRIHKWVQAGAISAKYHRGIVLAADARRLDVTAETMVMMHHRPDIAESAADAVVQSLCSSCSQPAASAAPSNEQPHEPTSQA